MSVVVLPAAVAADQRNDLSHSTLNEMPCFTYLDVAIGYPLSSRS